MAQTPARSHEYDTSSIDDGRRITPVMMVTGAVVAILAMMAIVYAPRIWGIAPYGLDENGKVAEHYVPAH